VIFFLAFLFPGIIVYPAVLSSLAYWRPPEPIETHDSDEAGGRAFIQLQRQLGSKVSGILFLNMFCSPKVDETRKFFVELDHGSPVEGRGELSYYALDDLAAGGSKPVVRRAVPG
jgi:hypothetical protein